MLRLTLVLALHLRNRLDWLLMVAEVPRLLSALFCHPHYYCRSLRQHRPFLQLLQQAPYAPLCFQELPTLMASEVALCMGGVPLRRGDNFHWHGAHFRVVFRMSFADNDLSESGAGWEDCNDGVLGLPIEHVSHHWQSSWTVLQPPIRDHASWQTAVVPLADALVLN
jgi:hypothetical protein